MESYQIMANILIKNTVVIYTYYSNNGYNWDTSILTIL
jgi:hypothetical protein